MARTAADPRVDRFLKSAMRWRKEMARLREILLGCPLTEDFKWDKPCYTSDGRNVVTLLPLKNYCALLFCKGALLKDNKGLLVRPAENTQAARQIRLTSLREIEEGEPALKAYVRQAVEVEQAGLDVVYKKVTEFPVPDKLRQKFDELPALKTAFTALTPGRQRGYLLYFSAPKQSKTRNSRIGKCTPQIFDGKGLNDR